MSDERHQTWNLWVAYGLLLVGVELAAVLAGALVTAVVVLGGLGVDAALGLEPNPASGICASTAGFQRPDLSRQAAETFAAAWNRLDVVTEADLRRELACPDSQLWMYAQAAMRQCQPLRERADIYVPRRRGPDDGPTNPVLHLLATPHRLLIRWGLAAPLAACPFPWRRAPSSHCAGPPPLS